MNTNRTITIQLKNNAEEMSLECAARWLSLMEAIYIVGRKADDVGVNIDKTTSWIKPIVFQKYLDERYPSMLNELELDKGIFCGGIKNYKELEIRELVEEES